MALAVIEKKSQENATKLNKPSTRGFVEKENVVILITVIEISKESIIYYHQTQTMNSKGV